MTTPTRYRPSQPPVEVDPDILRTEIPQAMQEARRWLLWRYQPASKPGAKPRKVPIYACGKQRTGKLDTAMDHAQLTTLSKALDALDLFPGYGIGFALGPSEDEQGFWQGIDLDGITQHPELTALLGMCPGYRERSPGGDGFHIIGLGKRYPALGSNKTGIEAYSGGRFLTVTGMAIGGDIADLEPFVREVLTPRHTPQASARLSAPPPASVAASSSPGTQPAEDRQRQIDELRDALPWISPDDYADWIAMGLALKELGQAGFELWDSWSQGSPKYQPKEMARRWASFSPDRTGAAAVFAAAQRRGWLNPASREARRQKQQAGGATENFSEKANHPFEPSEALRLLGSNPSGTPSGEGANPFGDEEETGFLLDVRDNGKGGTITVRKVESLAAVEVADRIRGRVALDRDTDTWHLWATEGDHWQPQTTAAKVEKILADLVARGTDPMGYRDAYLSGIVAILRKRDLVALPPPPAGTVPFRNGLLDLSTMTLRPATPDCAHDWIIPHDYNPSATCPQFLNWLTEAVDEDLGTVELLRAWMSAGLQGIYLQKVLILHGRGGTGKSTFTRVFEALLGVKNVAHTNLRQLEQNKFETARLVGKRLVSIAEAGKYGGDVHVLKKLSGGETVAIERKHIQQDGSFTFGGLLLVTTNDMLVTTDNTSGIERRRLQISFNRTASPQEREAWRRRGGEEGVLHVEIPGIVNWLLELREADIHRVIENPTRRVTDDNIKAMSASNAVGAWLVSCTRPVPWNGTYSDPNHTQVGSGNSRLESGARVYTDDPGSRAYPSYLKFCDETKRNPTSLPRFVSTVVDISEQLGHRIKHGKHASGRYGALFGLRLRQDWEEAFNWSALADGQIQP